MTMTGSPSALTNPSTNPSQPVPYRPGTRPGVPHRWDGFAWPMSCENWPWDGWTGSQRTRPGVPNPGARTAHPTDPANPSHQTATHRSDDHATPKPTGPTTATRRPVLSHRVPLRNGPVRPRGT